MTWTPIIVLPNINALEPFETDRIALTSARDKRIAEYPLKLPLENFLSKFVDQHGGSVSPSLIWWNASRNADKPELDAVCNFRDAVSISHVTHHRTKYLVGNPQFAHINYADYFAFYPWMLATDGIHLTYNIPVSGGMHELSSFQGQTSPGVPFRALRNEYDLPLFLALKRCWTSIWIDGAPSWKDIALYRSLNMAYAASVMPSGTQPASFYDYGRTTALWVSAFEILSRESPSLDANLNSVYKLLDGVPYLDHELQKPGYLSYQGRKSAPQKRNLSCWLYGELYHARNDFLHGNQVPPDRLVIQLSKRPLQNFAAPLYRLALTAFLDLRWENHTSDATEKDLDQFYFERSQRDAEQALLASQMPPA